MAMDMRRAFNAKFLTDLVWYKQEEGYFNDDNDWIAGKVIPSKIKGRIVAGNRFSQFEEGISLDRSDGGDRFRNHRELYVIRDYAITEGDKIGFRGKYYNILQRSDETVFGFNSFLIEESERWTP